VQRAAEIERENRQQPRYADEPRQQQTTEAVIANTQLPERAKTWLREHPEYITDPSKNATIISLHDVAKRQAGGSEWTDEYFTKMENLLGINPRVQSNRDNQSVRAAPRNSAPVRRQQYSGPPVSAPISREPPSMTTGRPQSFRAPLTRAEVEIARAAGITDAEYQRGKERVAREKSAGLHQNG
jgi:hypothetical protein